MSGRYGLDEISEVLGDKRHIKNYYVDGLKQRLLGPHSRDVVRISLLYKWISPPVAVDFEPSPLDGRMWLDEKCRWCHENGIAYVPIMLTERLTKQEFAQRVKHARAAMELDLKLGKERAALAAAGADGGGGAAVPPEVEAEIDREALRRLDAEIQKNTHLRGASRSKRLRHLKLCVIKEARKRGWRAWARAKQTPTGSG